MIKKIVLFAVMLISVAALAQEGPKSPRKILMEKADSCKSRNNYREALDIYEQVCEKYPDMAGFLSKDIQECKDKIKEPDQKKRNEESRKTTSDKSSVKKEEPKLELSEQAFYIFPEGTSKDLTVVCNNGWEISYCPPWCNVIRQTKDYLSLMFKENLTGVKRSDVIRISSGKLNKTITLAQDPMPEIKQKNCKVFFRTTPKNVEITILDSHVYRDYASHSFDLTPGEHRVTFNKLGYEPLDTLLLIPEAKDNNMMILDIAMKPTFGILCPVISLGDDHLISGDHPKAIFMIDGNYIDLDGELRARSFDSSEGVVNGVLYKGGCIPLEEGVYSVTVTAAGYKPIEEQVVVKKGESITFNKELELITGELLFHNLKNTDDADVYVEDLGIVVGKVEDTLRLPVGMHTVRLIKDGYICDNGDMMIDIKRDAPVEIKVSMTRVVTCMVSTENKMEEVRVNGDVIDFQAPEHIFPLKEGNEYVIKVSKEGYWPYTVKINPGQNDTLIDLRGIRLEQLSPVTIRTNEPGLYIHLYKKDIIAAKKRNPSKDDDCPMGPDFADMKAPMDDDEITLYIPKADYKMQMFRMPGMKELAYKGSLNFTKDKDHFTVQPAPKRNFLIFGLDYSLLKTPLGNSSQATAPFVGTAWLGQFKFIAPGLSTNIIKASIIDCKNMPVPEEIKPKDSGKLMFGASMLFLNYDFRVGGGFCQYGDVNLLMSYSWYPSFKTIIPMSHFSGHEVFGGLELSSRIKVFNINLRAGFQYLKGHRNFYQRSNNAYKIEERFLSSRFNRTMFVVTAGFAIGTKKANGRNIARVF